MEIMLTVNGKQVKATVDEKEMKEAMGDKKTGYEKSYSTYFYQSSDGFVRRGTVSNDSSSIECAGNTYNSGNMYSSREVAENNARADALIRKLRRFAAEHGGCRKPERNGWMIVAYPFNGKIFPKRVEDETPSGTVCFSSKEAAYTAITKYYDELNWYFTEYDPMPEGWWKE